VQISDMETMRCWDLVLFWVLAGLKLLVPNIQLILIKLPVGNFVIVVD
jgi:hypothetical protein